MSQNTAANKLFDLLTVRNFEDLQALSSATNKPPVNDRGQPDVAEADMFTFDWTAESGKDYGTVVILLNNEGGMDVFFGDNMGKTMETEDKQEWFEFLNQLKQFSTKNFMSFNPQNLNKLRFSLAGQAAIKEGLFESWKGNATTSWNGEPTQARLMVRHKKRMGESDARYRYIESMFVETVDGERYRLPFTRLSGGRAMVEHVRQGGKPYDLRGQHIVSMVEELNVLSRFRRANLGRIFEGDTQGLVTEANAYYENLNRMMASLAKPRGYETYFENWKPQDITQQDMVIEDIKTLFVEQNLDTRIEAALPILARIQQGTAMKEANIFEAWANQIMEGTWSTPDTPEKQKTLISLLSDELPVGADATNATELLYDLIGDDELFDQLHELADQDANADARELVLDRLKELQSIPDVAKVLVGVGVDLSEPETDDMDMDAADDKDLEEAEQDTSELDAEFGHGPYDSEVKGTRTATEHPDGQTDLEQTIQSTDTNAKGMTRTTFTQQKNNDVGQIRYYHGVMEGSIRDGVWSADPPSAGQKDVPPPSPNEGPTSKTPAPRAPAPAPKAPVKKADSGDMDIAEFGMPGRTQYVNTATGKTGTSLDAALTPPADKAPVMTNPAPTKAEPKAPAKKSDSGEGDAIAEYSAISRMTQGKPTDTTATTATTTNEALSRLAELAGMSRKLQERISIAPDAGPIQQTITPSGSEVWSNKPAGTTATPPAPGTSVPSNIKPPAVPAPANNLPNVKPFGAPPLGADGKPMREVPMDEEYEAYDDTLAQILKHAGVDGKVTPAPDYETGVTESMLTDSTGHTIDHILNRFKHEVKRFQNGDEIDTELYHALFDYYNDHGEMPYGIAKARDGDPINWISDKLAAKLGIDESSQDYASEQELDEVAPLVGAAAAAVPAIIRVAPIIMRGAEKVIGAGRTAAAGGAGAVARQGASRSADVAAGAATGATIGAAASKGASKGKGGSSGSAADAASSLLGGDDSLSDLELTRYIIKPLALETDKESKPAMSGIEADRYITKPLTLEGSCNMTAEGEFCPEHGLEECGMYEGDYGLTLAPTAESREFDLTRLKQLALGK